MNVGLQQISRGCMKSLIAVLSLTLCVGTAAQQLSPTTNTIPESLFGLDIHRLARGIPWPAVPFGSVRLWDSYTDWPHLEPQLGDWNFNDLDTDVEAAEA